MLRHTPLLAPVFLFVTLAASVPMLEHLAPRNSIVKEGKAGEPVPAADSLVIGRWEINSEELGALEDTSHRIRWVFQFSANHAYEMRLWMKEGAGKQGEAAGYVGIQASGDWFVHEGKLGMVPVECAGFAGRGEEECRIEADELGDTSLHVLRIRDGRRHMEQGILQMAWRGLERDMAPPSFWPAGLPVRRWGRLSPLERPGAGKPIDALGRSPTASALLPLSGQGTSGISP